MIDINKKYRTKDGLEVRLYATDGADDYPVHGAILIEGRWIFRTWTEEGSEILHGANHLDLVEIVEPKTVWLNFDGDGSITVYENEQDALKWRSDDHLRTYKIELTEDDLVELGDE